MKRLVLLVAIVTTLMSCDTHEKVKLSNGAFIDAINSTMINYKEFDEICVQRSKGTWYICKDGEMNDTVMFRASGNITHRVGRIRNY